MDKMRRQFDHVGEVDLTQVEDIHTVAGLLKLYLRLLPQQLVPFAVFQSLLQAYNSTRNTREKTLKCQLVFKHSSFLRILSDKLWIH